MFPIPWNFPFRKKNGNLVNLGDAIDGGTEIPEHDAGDAGKVLSVDENGDLEWSDDITTSIETIETNLGSISETVEGLGDTVGSIGGSLVSNWSGSGVNVISSSMKDITLQGIAFTVNEDKTIRAVGTSLTGFGPQIGIASLKAGITYKIFDTVNETVGNANAFIVAMDYNNTILMGSIDTEQYPNEYTPMQDIDVKVSFIILPNVTLDKLFFPSIIDASIDPGGYVVPAKSNVQLTAENQTLTNEIDGGWYKGRNLWNNSNVSGTETVTVTLKNPLPAGTYTLSAIVVSSDTDADTCLIYDTSNNASLGQIARSIGNDRVAITFTTANTINEIRFYASSYYNYSVSDTFSFTNIQIEKGESATKYVPYAMTNRELTDAIANSYVFKGMESKTVTSDGVKTYKELIEELRDTVNSYVTSLGAEYYIITRSIEIWSIQYNAISPKLAKILYDCRYRGFYFDGANAARIRECFPSTGTNTYLKELVFNTSPTIAINDMSDTTLANGATIVANFEVYKKV